MNRAPSPFAPGVVGRRGSVWDSNSPIDANVLIALAFEDATHGTPARGRTSALKWNRQLIAVKELGVASGIWLGRRDSNPNNRVQSAVSYR